MIHFSRLTDGGSTLSLISTLLEDN